MNRLASLLAIVIAALSNLPAAPAQDEYPRAHIFGRITDVEGRALEGVQVRLYSVGDRWVSKDLYPDALTGLRGTTNAEGAFEFDVPVPTADWTNFSLTPDEYHTRDSRVFGDAGGRDEEPLRAGENDLGTFVLANAGVIEGRITDALGEAILESRARLDEAGPGGLVLNSNRAEQGGVYRIPHVPAGQWTVESTADGFVSQTRVGIEVRPREVTTGIDFQLEASPSISGHVVDEEGRPLGGVRLRGWPVRSGQSASAHSASDGSFTLSLPNDTSYTIEAELDGYEHRNAGRAGPNYAPGARDARIVMHVQDRVTFVVQDVVTGEPVRQFGLKVIRVRTENGEIRGSSHDDPAAVTGHPGGVVELPAHTQYDDYTIVAPGYGPQRSDVWFDEGKPGQQTIKLMPSGVLIGRWTNGGEGVVRPNLRIRADRVPLVAGVTEGEDDIFSENWGSKLDAFAGRLRRFTGGPDGSFRIEDLAQGIYVLRLSAPGVAPQTVRGVRIASGQTTDMGEVAATRPGEIRGRVLLPAGISPAGLIVAPGSDQFADDDKAQTTNAKGEFVVGGLAEGKHYLWVEAKPGVVVRGGPTEVLLASGEVKSVRLELFDRVPCELRVQVFVNGQPADGAQVSARATKPRAGETPVGTTDSSGLVLGYMKGSGPHFLRVKGAGGLLIAEHSEAVDLLPGERRQVDLDLDAGHLTARVPASLLDTESLAIPLIVREAGVEDGPLFAFVHVVNWSVNGLEAEADLGAIAPGRYTLALHAGSNQLTAEVEVSSGEQAVCVFGE